MEKISHIVRGSTRVPSSDTKRDPAGLRATGPSLGGRQISETPKPTTQAQDAATVQQASDSFFMNRTRVIPEAKDMVQAQPMVHEQELMAHANAHDEIEELSGPHLQEVENIQPSGFTPRGSFVNVHA